MAAAAEGPAGEMSRRQNERYTVRSELREGRQAACATPTMCTTDKWRTEGEGEVCQHWQQAAARLLEVAGEYRGAANGGVAVVPEATGVSAGARRCPLRRLASVL